jgi:lysyl-tRNA synthetase, class II
VLGTTTVPSQGVELDFARPFTRVSVADAVRARNPALASADLSDRALLAAHCAGAKIHVRPEWGSGRLLMEIFEASCEHELVQPTFVTGYPTEVSPLSRRSDADPDTTDRFELYIGGREIANGFSELNDPEDQAARFLAQVNAKDAGDLEAMHFDADYIRALEYGMPPTAGEGVGIDRLVMLLADVGSIRDVLLFPYMRPEA